MALFTASLNSGSNGNCYYVGNKEDAVLIDAGLSCREIERRMKELGLSMQVIKAIFISHEHTDHIKGLTTLANRYYLPVYITEPTAKAGTKLIRHLSRTFVEHEPVQVGTLTVTAFSKHHDAIDPYSFIVTGNGISVGVFTDIGKPCDRLVHYFRQCHAAYLESNYDEVMLENGRYPIHLKNRIRSGNGHLSNRQALDLFIKHRSPELSHLFLSHLSKENNDPKLVQELFLKYADNTKIVIASRYEATEVFHIRNDVSASEPSKFITQPVQLGLFPLA
jgi:phosphoribosyl 1,2-cyclic phosphodiesterase